MTFKRIVWTKYRSSTICNDDSQSFGYVVHFNRYKTTIW